MLGVPGSSPLDFFWDKLDVLDREAEAQQAAVETVFQSMSSPMTEGSTLDAFIALLGQDSRLAGIDDETIRAVFDQVRLAASRIMLCSC